MPLNGKDVAAPSAGTFTLDVNRILFVNGQVFDGTGAPAVPADVVVRGDRIESVRPGGGTEIEPGDQVVDCTGTTVMPGLVESH